MKTKKALLVSLLSLSLVATSACTLFGGPKKSKKKKSSSSSSITSVEPGPGQRTVARIKITQLASAVTGDQVNLDDYIDVVYDDDTTDDAYEVEVPAASAELVSLDGHKVTFVKEGSVNLTIKAGTKTAKFSTTVLSALKSEFAAAVKTISSNFGLLELGYDSETQQYYIQPDTTHNEVYTCFSAWDEDASENVIPGGFMKVKSGTTYAYTLDANYENLEVDPEPYGTFENYYCNMPLQIEPAYFETKVDEDNKDYLFMDYSVPANYDFFESYVEEWCYCELAAYFKSSTTGTYTYKPYALEVYKEQLDASRERFLIYTYLEKQSDKSIVLYSADFLIYETDAEYGVQIVKDYIDSGAEPVSQDYTALKNKFAEIAEAKNFTVHSVSHEYYLEDDLETIKSTQYTFTDVVLANETQYEDKALYEPAEGDAQQVCQGLVENGGSLYSYSFDSATSTYPATLIAAGQSIYVDKLSSTFACLGQASLWSEFYVSKVENMGTYERYTLAVAKSRPFIDAFLAQTYGGDQIAYVVEQYKARTGHDFLNDYADAYIDLAADSVTVYLQMLVQFSDANVLWDITATFSDIGSTAAIDTDVVYPNS